LDELTQMVVKLQAEQQVLDGERVLLFEALVAVRYLDFKFSPL